MGHQRRSPWTHVGEWGAAGFARSGRTISPETWTTAAVAYVATAVLFGLGYSAVLGLSYWDVFDWWGDFYQAMVVLLGVGGFGVTLVAGSALLGARIPNGPTQLSTIFPLLITISVIGLVVDGPFNLLSLVTAIGLAVMAAWLTQLSASLFAAPLSSEVSFPNTIEGITSLVWGANLLAGGATVGLLIAGGVFGEFGIVAWGVGAALSAVIGAAVGSALDARSRSRNLRALGAATGVGLWLMIVFGFLVYLAAITDGLSGAFS